MSIKMKLKNDAEKSFEECFLAALFGGFGFQEN